MGTIRSYKDLLVWQEGIELVTKIYELCKGLPESEVYGIASQMKRAAISIPANISEGYARNHRKEYRRFVLIAVGSLSELETLVFICVKLGFVLDVQIEELEELMRKLKSRLLLLASRLQ